MHSARVVLPEPACPSKTIFFTCEVSNSGIAIKFIMKKMCMTSTNLQN
jgi:hypothetical protein